MAFLVLEHFGISTTDVLTGKEVEADRVTGLDRVIARVNDGEPVQYVLGEAWFYGMKFRVDPSVLIPRPETEWLVDRALTAGVADQKIRVLDLCTGSGAIAVAIARSRPGWSITATDLSAAALKTAYDNAQALNAPVTFLQHDTLSGEPPVPERVDVIVSNPPYIPMRERDSMPHHVVGHEPSMALFTADVEGLEFYRSISSIAREGLVTGGTLAVEIHEQAGMAVVRLFIEAGFLTVEVIKDQFGKERYVTARR